MPSGAPIAGRTPRSRAANVYLVRHATPDLSRTELVYHLPPGPPLTGLGEAQAAELGRFLRRRGVRGIWSSPLERARRTADLAALVCGAEVVIDARLIEMQPGETHADVHARAEPAWDVVLEASAHGPQALVAHGGVITALLLALGVASETLADLGRRFDSGNPVPPAGAWVVRVPGATGLPSARLVFIPNLRPPEPWPQTPTPVSAPASS
jgi:broad specificity phosphatase PhoE